MQTTQTDYPRHGAVISDDQLYRFVLTRWFDEELKLGANRERENADRHLPFIMHNSSTADGLRDDHSIRKCCGFAERFGYGGIVVGNLYGYRARDPNALFTLKDPVGADNDLWLARIFARLPTGGSVICAWGSLKAPGKAERIRTVVRMAEDAGVVLKALDVSLVTGEPNHPLMLAYDLKPIVWRPRPTSS